MDITIFCDLLSGRYQFSGRYQMPWNHVRALRAPLHGGAVHGLSERAKISGTGPRQPHMSARGQRRSYLLGVGEENGYLRARRMLGSFYLQNTTVLNLHKTLCNTCPELTQHLPGPEHLLPFLGGTCSAGAEGSPCQSATACTYRRGTENPPRLPVLSHGRARSDGRLPI